MDSVKIKIPRAALAHLHSVLAYELESQCHRLSDECIDLRDWDEVEKIYMISLAYKSVCQELGE